MELQEKLSNFGYYIFITFLPLDFKESAEFVKNKDCCDAKYWLRFETDLSLIASAPNLNQIWRNMYEIWVWKIFVSENEFFWIRFESDVIAAAQWVLQDLK